MSSNSTEDCPGYPDEGSPDHTITDLDILSHICPRKDAITDEDIETYSQQLSGHEKNLFDDLNPEQKRNVLAFSMIDPKEVNKLEMNPHYMPGIHSRDVAFLIRVHRACEACRKTVSNTLSPKIAPCSFEEGAEAG